MKFNALVPIEKSIIALLAENPAIEEYTCRLPRDVVGGEVATYAQTRSTSEDFESFVTNVRKSGKKCIYSLTAPCLGNLEYVKNNINNLINHLEYLGDLKITGIRASNPFLIDFIAQRFPLFSITAEGVKSISEACYYADIGVQRISIAPDCNRKFDMIEKLRKAVSLPLEFAANSIRLIDHPLSENAERSQGHASQSVHQNEGFALAYYEAKVLQVFLKHPEELLFTPWVRPEDIGTYESMGFSDCKIFAIHHSLKWIEQLTYDYSKRSHQGDLLSIMNGFGFNEWPVFDDMILGRPDMAHSKRTLRVKDAVAGTGISIDNETLGGFLDHIRSHTKEQFDINECSKCSNFAKKALLIDKEATQTRLRQTNQYLANIISASIFTEDSAFKVPTVRWAEGVQVVFDKLIAAKPEFVHEVAREGIMVKAEKNARERQSTTIDMVDVVKANLSETPEPFRRESVKQMEACGIRVENFVQIKDFIPTWEQQIQSLPTAIITESNTPAVPVSSGQSGKTVFANNDQTWQVITAFLSKVNSDEEARKSIPKGSPSTLQYIFSDTGFKYFERVGEGKVDFEKGEAPQPDVVLTMDSLTYHEMMSGTIHPVQASESKRCKVEGPVFKLIKIQNLLGAINKVYPSIAQDILSGKTYKTVEQPTDSSVRTANTTVHINNSEDSKTPHAGKYRDCDTAWKVISAIISEMNSKEENRKAIPKGQPVVVQYRLTDIGFNYYEKIGEGKIESGKGDFSKPDVVLTMDSTTYHDIMNGNLHPVQASESKRSKVEGPVFKLIKIQNVLNQINKIYSSLWSQFESVAS